MQMINELNITDGYSAAQAAEILGVQTHEITRLFRSEVLKGRKIAGGTLLLDSSSVQLYKAVSRGRGHPWDAQTAWAALLMLDGRDASWLSYHRRRRLLQKIKSISAEDLVWLARKRSTAQSYSVSQSFSNDLKKFLSLSGTSASPSADMGLVASTRLIDGYAKDVDCIIKEFFLMPDMSGNCVIRIALEAPDDLLCGEEMPAAVVAADLAVSIDARERRCGLDYLEVALDGIR